MKKNKLLITLVFLTSGLAIAQVGINNQSPKATLDITAKNTNGSTAEGLIAPRLTGDQIKAADAQYGTGQKGTIVYATEAVTIPSTKTSAIAAEGYYYFDGNLWQKMNGPSSVDLTNDAWVNDTANNMVKLGTQTDGSIRTAGTDFIVKDNGQIAIGTSTPAASAVLDITSSNKGLLLPRVALNSKTDMGTITSPTEGLLVYNTGLGALKSSGMYYWDGFQWTSFKTDGGTSSPSTDLNIGETRTTVINVPTSSFVTGSTGINRIWMNGRDVSNTQIVNYKLLSDAAGSTSDFINFGPNGILRMDFASGGYSGASYVAPKIVNTSSSSVFYSLNALSTADANFSWGTGMWLAPGAVCKQIDGNDGISYTTNGLSEYVNVNILVHNTIDGSARFYIATWSIMAADDGLGHANTYGLFTITRYK